MTNLNGTLNLYINIKWTTFNVMFCSNSFNFLIFHKLSNSLKRQYLLALRQSRRELILTFFPILTLHVWTSLLHSRITFYSYFLFTHSHPPQERSNRISLTKKWNSSSNIPTLRRHQYNQYQRRKKRRNPGGKTSVRAKRFFSFIRFLMESSSKEKER